MAPQCPRNFYNIRVHLLDSLTEKPVVAVHTQRSKGAVLQDRGSPSGFELILWSTNHVSEQDAKITVTGIVMMTVAITDS